jgi:glycosyltransferase involved in cell wall biosynthesis
MRFHLPLLYDLVASTKPKSIVSLGFGDGEGFFTFCQAVREQEVAGRCAALRRARKGETETEDAAWQKGRKYGEEFYGDFARFFSDSSQSAEFADGSIDLLLVADCDSGSELRADLAAWESKLARNGLVLFHGTGLERSDSPKKAWRQWAGKRTWAEFPEGIGISVTLFSKGSRPQEPLLKMLFAGDETFLELKEIYRLVAARVEAQARADEAVRAQAELEARQVWLDSLLADRWKVQAIMDHQQRAIAELEQRFEPILEDRKKAQQVMDAQLAEIQALREEHGKPQEIMEAQLRDLAMARADLEALRIDRGKAQAVMDGQAEQLKSFQTIGADFEALRIDREKAQEIMDAQLRDIEGFRRDRAALQLIIETQEEQLQHYEALRRDRAQAQLVMDSQLEQLKHWMGESETLRLETERLRAKTKEQKRILSAAKNACRKKGQCFHIPTGPKENRPLGEKIVRELLRLPRNLGIARSREPTPTLPEEPAVVAAPEPLDRYAAWCREHEPDEGTLDDQRREAKRLPVRPKISLIVPIWNTPAHFLQAMLESLSAQTYDNWELCAVDAASDRPATLAVLREWTAREPRIRLERIENNLGISENTNRALGLATGDFIACIDHDDLLAPFALFELARNAGAFPDTDIFYSDEDRWSEAGERHAPFFKPEWSPELLQSFMYIGHLTAYRRSLVDQVGEFRKEFDLSQDYDFALRATERARNIRHIPYVLYHWREHPASGSMGGKPEARKTNLAALGDAMRRRNLPADIIEYPTANRARLRVASWPRVSVIVPTDSPTRALICLRDLPRQTKYPDLEIVLVTNSKLVESLRILEPPNATVQLVPYDKPFNFSDKCNLGAEASSGKRLIFFNDDVETGQADWIQNLIEQLENPEVGAVSPKLLYETGKIQHAGLVTGVRGLVGTAFHQRDANSTEYFNLPQSLRDVGALSAACLAMRRADFFRVGGFDALNTPIAHSDIDLCFKVREAGMRCVYTPYATLSHAGHVSIAAEEKKETARRPNKASLYLLKRWADYTTRDPYFTDNMRDWLHSDSPTPIRMAASDRPDPTRFGPDLLFVSHDLTLSGAPILLFHLALWCNRNEIFVVVVAPEDGPLREKYEAAGLPLIIDPLVLTGHESFVKFAQDFDCMLANTIRSEPAVRAAHAAKLPVIWWVHETQVGEHFLRADAKLRSALPLADAVLAPSERTARVYRPYAGPAVKHSSYGVPDMGAAGRPSGNGRPRALRFLVLGSIEPRKGQDIFVEAVASLPAEMQQAAEFHILGRVMDSEFSTRVEEAAAKVLNFSMDGACDHAEAVEAIRRSDVLVCSSRDEAMPVTILEALSLAKAVVSTEVGGIGEILEDGHDALLVRPEDPKALAEAMKRLWETPELVQQLGENARETFEKNFTEDRFGADFRELIFEVMAGRATQDPYSPDRLRVRSSPAAVAPGTGGPSETSAAGAATNLLFVSHDLSLSGAPMMLFHAVKWLHDNGAAVAVLAPKDGPLRQALKEQGIEVIIDPLLEAGHKSLVRFARGFDCMVANTIRSGAAVRAMQAVNVPIAWWLHEPGSVAGHFVRADPRLREALRIADVLFAPSEQTAGVYRAFIDRPVTCLRNAIPDLREEIKGNAGPSNRPLRFLLLASIEPRKGQDVFVDALAMLPREVQQAGQFEVVGRVLARNFWQKTSAVAETLTNFSAKGAVSHAEAIALINRADVVLSASRDEAMPTVTILEAMCLGKALIVSSLEGVSDVLVDGENALLVRPEAPDALAAAIRRLISEPGLASRLGKKARETYERDFTMERFGSELRELLDGVMAIRASTPQKRLAL